jgi:hypothetical protein
VAAIRSRITAGAFGSSFPEECADGRGIVGTNAHDMGLAVLAQIPELAEAELTRSPRMHDDRFTGWPLQDDRLPSTLAVIDLIEFCHDSVAKPIELDYHDFFSHRHLRFDAADGQSRWRADVNALFARNGLAYEIADAGLVVRLGTPIITETVRSAIFDTGDDTLDSLLERARDKYLSADPTHRSESLEQLWDAFERAKTILDSDKKVGATKLIDRAASSPELAAALEAEARALTKIGNDFRIRHHETTQAALSPGDVDYLFDRCFALLAHLLGLNPS